MDQLTKVIEGLECCIYNNTTLIGRCPKCPYYEKTGFVVCRHVTELKSDALALLKAQVPRILTTEEYRAWCELPTEKRDPLFFECRDGNMAWCWWPAVSPETDMDMYHIWTARPTDAQREATPWQSN